MSDERTVSGGDAEPARDRELAESLRRAEWALYGDVPDDIAAAPRRRAIALAAAPALSRLRAASVSGRRTAAAGGGASWWEWTASWSRPAIPLGLAAAIAAVMLVLASRDRTAAELSGRASEEQLSLVTAALQSASAPEAVEAVIGPAWRDWLITAAITEGATAGDGGRFAPADSARK